MPIALDPKQTFDYVLKAERDLPAEQQTVFELRGLTIAQETAIADAMMHGTAGSSDFGLRQGTTQLMSLRFGLRGWRNFKNADGVEVAFETQKGAPRHVTDACLDYLSGPDRSEIANAITERHSVTAEEGNS